MSPTEDQAAPEETNAPDPDEEVFPEEIGEAPSGRLSASELRMPTWELELLISGAVVFALLRLPSVFTGWIESSVLHLPESLFLFVFLGVVYLQMAVYILIFSFLFHLAARAYWVGLIGLHSIFPGGIVWSEVKHGPRLKEVYREKTMSTPDLISRTGAVCSGIFSFSFSIVVVFLVSMVWALAIFGASFLCSEVVGWGLDTWMAFHLVLGFFFAPFFAAQLLDKLVGERRLPRWLDRLMRRIMRLYSTLFGARLINAVQMTFASNIPKRYVYPLFLVVFFGAILLTLIRTISGLGLVELSGYHHFPAPGDRLHVATFSYRDVESEGAPTAPRPTIQSSVIEGPYVQLFLPYRPMNDDYLDVVCPDLPPLRTENPLRLGPGTDNLDAEILEETRRCLGSLWRIRLDGEPVDAPRFEFHIQPPRDVRGLLTHLPVRDLAPGRHVLRVERLRPKPKEEQGEDYDEKERRRVYEIPFWI